MNQDPNTFKNFLASARRGRPQIQSEAPMGFASRISACCFAGNEDRLAPWEKLARWGALAASVVAIVVAVYGRPDASFNFSADLADDAEDTELFW